MCHGLEVGSQFVSGLFGTAHFQYASRSKVVAPLNLGVGEVLDASGYLDTNRVLTEKILRTKNLHACVPDALYIHACN